MICLAYFFFLIFITNKFEQLKFNPGLWGNVNIVVNRLMWEEEAGYLENCGYIDNIKLQWKF